MGYELEEVYEVWDFEKGEEGDVTKANRRLVFCRNEEE